VPLSPNSDPTLTAAHTDIFLSYFIFARKGDVERAKVLLQGHMKWREEYEIDKTDLVAVKRILFSGVFGFLPAHMRGVHGEGVGFIFASNVPGNCCC
jgi:hypothetical protein